MKLVASPGPFGRWGARDGNLACTAACDRYLTVPDQTLTRSVDVLAPAPVVFRWLCQLKVAPYSYDWIDNHGRRSPRTITPGVETLAIGQRFMSIFELVHFTPGRDITLLHDGPIFGRVVCTYSVTRHSADRSRIGVHLLVRYPRLLSLPLSCVLPAGDLVMMRRQLLNLKRLAESSSMDPTRRGQTTATMPGRRASAGRRSQCVPPA